MFRTRLLALLQIPALVLSLFDARAAQAQLSGRVVDENGLVVVGAVVTLTGPQGSFFATSGEAGWFVIPEVPPGIYRLKIEKRGFYAFQDRSIPVSEKSAPLEVTLNHLQEYEETVSVEYSTPPIDRTEAAVQTTLTSEEIVDLSFSATHDFRNALPLMPGVVKDRMGRIHINGGGEDQVFYSLDGFNITSPVSGILENRISVDALRAVRVETSRYSAEYGKGSSGVMALESSRGDDRFRFSATNFLPSYEFHNGIGLSNWTPRATFSGPIRRGRAWYFNALDLQYDLNVVDGLPSTENTNRNWFGSNLSRMQFNINNANILTLSFLVNFRNSRHLGITPLDPVETSTNRRERFYLLNAKYQAYFGAGWAFELGFGLNRLKTREKPQGTVTYTISPEGRSGNYFLHSEGTVRRAQWLASLLAPTLEWSGRHSIKFGIDLNRIRYRQISARQPYEVHRRQGSRARLVSFSGEPGFGKENFEFSSFVQDRWSLSEHVLLEAGLRLDWDQILREPLWSPRLSATWVPGGSPDTKFSAGVGVFYDATNLGILTRELDQQRSDTFFAEDGTTVLQGPVLSLFRSEERRLRAPSHLNWSIGWEQRLPRSFYARVNFVRKVGRQGWAYDLLTSSGEESVPVNLYRLDTLRRDRYRYLEMTVTRTFRDRYPWLLSYALSKAHSSAVIDFKLENPITAGQAGGPLDWDVPHRLISWGFLPAPYLRKYTVAYFLEWHGGFPFTVVDGNQKLVGAPNGARFPDYLSLNVHLERRFRLWRHQWALRAGFNNITGRQNPVVVNNNIDSPNFGSFGGGQGRVFTGRIRFLGRN